MEKTGIELIAEERQEQIEKHGRTLKSDKLKNNSRQLCMGAVALLREKGDANYFKMPATWDDAICKKMVVKSYKERLIIAGALIAAEIDRINSL